MHVGSARYVLLYSVRTYFFSPKPVNLNSVTCLSVSLLLKKGDAKHLLFKSPTLKNIYRITRITYLQHALLERARKKPFV